MGYQRLGLTTGHRKAMLRNMVTSLLKENRIKTTETRAKQVKSIAEKMITLSKKGDLAARRQVLAYICMMKMWCVNYLKLLHQSMQKDKVAIPELLK